MSQIDSYKGKLDKVTEENCTNYTETSLRMKESPRYESQEKHHYLMVLVLTSSIKRVLFDHFPWSLEGQTLLS